VVKCANFWEGFTLRCNHRNRRCTTEGMSSGRCSPSKTTGWLGSSSSRLRTLPGSLIRSCKRVTLAGQFKGGRLHSPELEPPQAPHARCALLTTQTYFMPPLTIRVCLEGRRHGTIFSSVCFPQFVIPGAQLKEAVRCLMGSQGLASIKFTGGTLRPFGLRLRYSCPILCVIVQTNSLF
jgi:hypothetical protein